MFAGKGQKVEFDAEKMEVTNIPDLNKYIRREYRKGWEAGKRRARQQAGRITEDRPKSNFPISEWLGQSGVAG